MNLRLGLLGLSSALLLGHLFRYFPGMRQGVSLVLGTIGVAVAIAAVAGVIAMFMGRRYLMRVDVIMGLLPSLLIGGVIVSLVIIGGLI